MKKLFFGLCVLGFLFSGRAFGDSSDYKQSFFYGGIIGGYADVDWSSVVVQPGLWNEITVGTTNPASVDSTGFAYGADLGYQFSSYFAVEGQYMRMPTSQLNFNPILYLLSPYNLTSSTGH
jgi:hypothetical protein